MNLRLVPLALWAVLAQTLSGCGGTFTQVRMDWSPYDAQEFRQDHGGVLLTNHLLEQVPQDLIVPAQRCNSSMVPLVDAAGAPVNENVLLIDPRHGQTFYKVTLTNNTDHVLRLNRAAVRLFDPAGNQYEALDKDALGAMLLTNRPCTSTASLLPRVKLMKLVDRSAEIVPGSSYTGYVPFLVGKDAMLTPGTWKLGIYEVPVDTDDAGTVTKTVQFEVRTTARRFVDTYQRKFMAQPVLLESEESM